MKKAFMIVYFGVNNIRKKLGAFGKNVFHPGGILARVV